MSEDAVLDGREGMLDGASTKPHHCGGHPFLHPVQCLFIQVAAQAASRSSCATRLQRTSTAVAGRCLILREPVLQIDMLTQQPLVSRTDVSIRFRFIAEVLA